METHVFVNHPKLRHRVGCTTGEKLFDDFLSLNIANKEVPEHLKELGLGPSMYLIFLKGLTRIFIILTLVNLPLLLIFVSGSAIEGQKLTQSEKIFGMLNIGNLGINSITSAEFEVKMSFSIAPMPNPVKLKCKNGFLSRLLSFGILNRPTESISNNPLLKEKQN